VKSVENHFLAENIQNTKKEKTVGGVAEYLQVFLLFCRSIHATENAKKK
jgi:hypothetical protein